MGARIYCLDWMRAFACVAVVLIHVTQGIMSNYPLIEVGSGRATVWCVMQIVVCRWAVPVFFMVTGALLLNPARPLGWDRVRRYAGRMIGVLATFGLAFCLIEAIFETRSFDIGSVFSAVINLLSGRSWSHMWYIYALLGLYLISPALYAYVRDASRQDLRVALVVLFVLTLCVPTINAACGLELDTLIWVSSSVFWYLFGSYAWRFMEFDKRVAAVGLTSLVVTCVVQVILISTGEYGDYLRETMI